MSPPSSHTPPDSFLGLVLQGKYEIISEIGRGGMGRVYRARHRELEKDVAIKVIDTDVLKVQQELAHKISAIPYARLSSQL